MPLVWVNYNDRTRPRPKMVVYVGNGPQPPYFRLVKYYSSPRLVTLSSQDVPWPLDTFGVGGDGHGPSSTKELVPSFYPGVGTADLSFGVPINDKLSYWSIVWGCFEPLLPLPRLAYIFRV